MFLYNNSQPLECFSNTSATLSLKANQVFENSPLLKNIRGESNKQTKNNIGAFICASKNKLFVGRMDVLLLILQSFHETAGLKGFSTELSSKLLKTHISVKMLLKLQKAVM